jgi:hypothetical protein
MLNELLSDGAFAFPLLELDGSQPSPDVRIQVSQCRLDLFRADSEETNPSGRVLVDPGDARFQRIAPVPRRKLSDFGCHSLFRPLRQRHFHFSLPRLSPQAEAEKVPVFGNQRQSLDIVACMGKIR